jgi:lysophospholipase L1-like esterase
VDNAGIIGRGVIRRVRLTAGAGAALLTLLLFAGPAGAAPQLGRWEGSGPDGFQVRFEVMQVKGGARRAITYLAYSCPHGGELNLGTAAQAKGDAVIVRPGDTGRPHVYAIAHGGQIEPARAGGSELSPSLEGRLKQKSATVRLVGYGLACDSGKLGSTVRLHVRAVPGSPPPRAGAWVIDNPPPSALRFEAFGASVQYFNGHLLTGIGTYEGVPYPCVSTFVDTLATWLPADGSFLVERPEPPDPARFTGTFPSETTLSGTYLVSPPPADVVLFRCSAVPFPFTAHLEKAAPPPRLEGDRLTDPGASDDETLPTPTQPTDYVALGDSYSSGEGVKPFDPETNTKTNRCHRSAHAYSRVFAPPGYQLNRTFLACSGAITDNVGHLDASRTVVGTPQDHDDSGLLQLSRLDSATWSSTDLSTITIGGNDAQFANVLKQCVVLACNRGKRARRITERIASDLPPLLESTYAAIRHTAPNATVLTLGYPQLFPDDPRDRCPIGKRVVSRAKQVFLRERGEQLNAIIREQATAAGFHFVNAEPAFRGHEPCGKKEEWIHSLVLPLRFGPDRGELIFSFHPNQKGQRAYAAALRGYLACLYGRGFPFEASGVPEPVNASQPAPDECR